MIHRLRKRRRLPNQVLPIERLDPEWLYNIVQDEQAFAAWVENTQELLQTAVETYSLFLQGKAPHSKLTNAYLAVGNAGRQMASIEAAYPSD